MKRTDPISKPKLFIEELERPATAYAGQPTTLAAGEESGGGGKVTSLSIGEEAVKIKAK